MVDTTPEYTVPTGAGRYPLVVLVTAVPLELEPLVPFIENAVRVTIGGKPAVRGRIDGRDVVAVAGGMGKTNAAHAVTTLMERSQVTGVVGFGVAGAYVGGGAEVGDLVLASREVYGDEGVQAPDRWISVEGIGIPLVEVPGLRRFDEFPLDERLVEAAAKLFEERRITSVTGTFVTVSTCSGTQRRGEELRTRFGAVCENMEGAAVAHVCALYGVRYLEVRGVSNRVEDRDLAAWRLHEAAADAARAAALLVELFHHVHAPGAQGTPA